MGGKASRDKGKRGEYGLRDHFRDLGYEAIRVPLSGASEGYKGDVVASKDGKEITLELKCRKNQFKSIYAILDTLSPEVIGLWYNTPSDGALVGLSYSFEALASFNGPYTSTESWIKQFPNYKRVLKKIITLRKLVVDCDYLAIKNDRKPFIFLKFT